MITPKYYPRSAESAGTVGTCTVGEAVFTHPRVGQAERLACHWQPNAFCGLTPTPTFAARGPKGREKKCAFAQCRNYDAVDKEEAIFSLSLTSSTIPPPFGPVSRCVGRMGTGKHPCPQTPACGPCQAVWRKSETAAETRFHPKIGGEPTG